MADNNRIPDHRHKGVLKKWDGERGQGFVRCYGKRVLVFGKQLRQAGINPSEIKSGLTITFKVRYSKTGTPRAVDIVALGQEQPQPKQSPAYSEGEIGVGTLFKFRRNMGYGFIQPSDSQKRPALFVHISDVPSEHFEEFRHNAIVHFRVTLREKGPCAIVTKVESPRPALVVNNDTKVA